MRNQHKQIDCRPSEMKVKAMSSDFCLLYRVLCSICSIAKEKGRDMKKEYVWENGYAVVLRRKKETKCTASIPIHNEHFLFVGII